MFAQWIALFWVFVKVNLLTTSGPASVGLLRWTAVPGGGRQVHERERLCGSGWIFERPPRK